MPERLTESLIRRGLLDAVRPVVFPVIWGGDLSGVVAEVGPAVTLFKPGDEVAISWLRGPAVMAGSATL